jgi:hypothetical protein
MASPPDQAYRLVKETTGFKLRLGRSVAKYTGCGICDCQTRSRSPILDIHIAVYEFSPILQPQPDDDPPIKGPNHVVDFFNNLKIQLCYDGLLYT